LNPVRVGFGICAFQRRRDQNIASGLEELVVRDCFSFSKTDDRPVFWRCASPVSTVESLFIGECAVDIADRDDAHTVLASENAATEPTLP